MPTDPTQEPKHFDHIDTGETIDPWYFEAHVSECYSTREAAEAAKGGRDAE